LVQAGKNVREIAAELNEKGLGIDPRTNRPVEWGANLLLRGAILTSGHLPLEIFAADRDIPVRKTTIQRTPNP